MKNPYDVLGVPQGAPIEQVKAAYKELAAKYQDNSYQTGPLADIANKKMEELDEAYDAIIMNYGDSAYQSTGRKTQQGFFNAFTDFSDIREKIVAGRLDDAELLLDGTPPASRTAEWYYLKGTVQQRRGWLEEAAANFEKAAQKDPSNSTYRAASDNIRSSRMGGYRTQKTKDDGCGFCDICSGLMCADCCCECMGGDLIPCC